MKNQISLSAENAKKYMNNWSEARSSYNKLQSCLKANYSFSLSKGNFNRLQIDSDSINAYLGLRDNQLMIIWIPVSRSGQEVIGKEIIASLYLPLKESLYLIDENITTQTNYIELSENLDLKSKNSLSHKVSANTRDSISSATAFDRVNQWKESYLDWAYICQKDDESIVRLFSIPTVDFSGQFINEDVTEVSILFGLYWSDLVNCSIPDLIIVGNQNKPTSAPDLKSIVERDSAGGAGGEVTDLIRPCPPFCKPPKGTLSVASQDTELHETI